MEKDQIIILEKRGVISISGTDATIFLQNIVTNDVVKVTKTNSIFSGLLTPQGKYLDEFFIIKSENGYFLDCSENSSTELIGNLSKYKLRSNIEIRDVSKDFVIGIISPEKFKNLQIKNNQIGNTIYFRDTPVFLDPRNFNLGARILSNLDKLYLTIKKLNLKIIDNKEYYFKAYKLGIPEKGLQNLKNQLFGLEANFEQLQAIDFKKGCFIGQENTARMKLKNKLRRRLLPILSSENLNIGDNLIFDKKKIGKILIDKPFPFGLIKMFDPGIKVFENKELLANNKKCKILNSVKQS